MHSHFLGRRYNLIFDEKTAYEVFPNHVGYHPITNIPQSVTFSIWTGTPPKPRFTPEYRQKTRKWEEEDEKRKALQEDLKDVDKQMKEVMHSWPKFDFEGGKEIFSVGCHRFLCSSTQDAYSNT